ncbi:hypothetical protein LOD99_4501 [Oopsacas minuta]|uniref:Uncharacterized protein n=1 Tax=Oopsacas minuta TaxID=111878 RepID=A0AAV7JUR7_9METZ|nr:hypothetical protein LOD99_4501 [Oopsacas minuta]
MLVSYLNILKQRVTSYKKSLNEISLSDIIHFLDVWGKRLAFYCGFYCSMGIFLILHILVFMCIAWQYPLPLNAGYNLGYTNYPNSKFHLSSSPEKLELTLQNGTLLTNGGYSFETISEFVNDTKSTNCTCSYNKNSNKKCVLVSLNKVILWKPQLVDLKLAFQDYLPLDCNITSQHYNLTVSTCAPGIPLSLNNTNGRSYPFISQPNYIKPKLAVEIDFSNYSMDTGISAGQNLKFEMDCQLRACAGISSIHCPITLYMPISIST